MYKTTAPKYPDYVDDDDRHLSTVRLAAFSGMQITDGPYGAVSDPGLSDGTTHAAAEKSLDVSEFIAAIAWVLRHEAEIRSKFFPALMIQYEEMREILIDEYGDEEAAAIVPKIESPEDLASFCGLVALHIGGRNAAGEARFGIELGCDWDDEHGAGVRFNGLAIEQAGDAHVSFMFRS